MSSNPVFRSKETPPEPKTAAHRQRSFFIPPHAPERKTGFSPRPSPPSCGGPGRIQKARNTRADFESLRTKNQCEFEPRFPLNKVSKGLPTAAPEQKTTLTDIPNENKIPHLPKVCILDSPPSKGVHFPRDITPPSEGEFPYHVHQSICSGVLPPFCLSTPPEGEQKHKEIYSPSKGGTATKPPTPNISLLSAGFRTFAALWQTIISKEDTTNTWNGRPQPRKRSGQPGRSGSTPIGSIWQKQPPSPKTVQNLK